jgi:hypothetical protein
MRLLTVALLSLVLTACEISMTPTTPSSYTTHSSYVYEVCYEEAPYYDSPDYCEEYAEGYCCEWYSYSTTWDVCYEEWCVWDDVCGWEYYGDNCYTY